MDAFSAPRFTNDVAARAFLQDMRWPDGPICPHCGVISHAYPTRKVGVYRCAEAQCRKDFSVTTGTVMESSHIPLHKWMQGFYLMASSKKGFSAHQLHRTLDIGYRAAWFMEHRIRAAMETGGLGPLGGEGKTVEADETYYGKYDKPRERKTKRYTKPTKGGKVGPAGKRVIVSLVERGGNVRSFHVALADKETVYGIVKANVERQSRLYTDESRLYSTAGEHFAAHETVNHSAKEYARGDVHINTAEGFFGLFKRGMKGIYQHCKEKHLHRYLIEFDFRYNARKITDAERAILALKGAEGKRLTYRRPDPALI